LAAAKILALSSSSLARKIEQYLREAKRAVEKMDAEIKAKRSLRNEKRTYRG